MYVNEYKRREVVVSAMQYLGEVNYDGACEFVGAELVMEYRDSEQILVIPNPAGELRADKGDFIIQSFDGTCYPCKPDAFHKLYERVVESPVPTVEEQVDLESLLIGYTRPSYEEDFDATGYIKVFNKPSKDCTEKVRFPVSAFEVDGTDTTLSLIHDFLNGAEMYVLNYVKEDDVNE